MYLIKTGYDMNKNRILRSGITAKGTIHNIRLVFSFALLGAIVAGAFFSWVDPEDARALGAALGSCIFIGYKILHLA